MSQQQHNERQEKKELSEEEMTALTHALKSLYTRFPLLRNEEYRVSLELLDERADRNP